MKFEGIEKYTKTKQSTIKYVIKIVKYDDTKLNTKLIFLMANMDPFYFRFLMKPY